MLEITLVVLAVLFIIALVLGISWFVFVARKARSVFDRVEKEVWDEPRTRTYR